MNKPFIMLKNELMEKIVTAINESGLDICIVEMILEDIMRDVSRVVDREAKKQMEEYEAAIAASQEEEIKDVEFEDVAEN